MGRLVPLPGYTAGMRHEGDVRIKLSRAELSAAREAIELTPNFEGRVDVRDRLRGAMRARSHSVALEREVAERFVRRLVAVDLPTALLRTKLLLAIQDADRQVPEQQPGAEHPARAA
jgi:hypothetical protein